MRVLGVPEVKEDSVTKILESRGIKYSHRNDDILVPNAIEEQQMRKARKVQLVRFRQIELLTVWNRNDVNEQRRPGIERRLRNPTLRGHRKGSITNDRPVLEPSMFLSDFVGQLRVMLVSPRLLQTLPASDGAYRDGNDSVGGRHTCICAELVCLFYVIRAIAHLLQLFSIKQTPEEQTELLAKLDAHRPRTR
jgi:Helicase-associated putative binding domain, C-terminal